jgi:hypothetical protein
MVELIVESGIQLFTRRIIYLLGDVTMEKQTNYEILSRLEGLINVVLRTT